MIETQVKPISFTQAVFLRPTMYTLGGTFAEVVAFLEGYYSGIATGNPYALSVSEWETFRSWLAAQFCVDNSEVFTVFLNRCGNSQMALTELASQLARFEESKARA